MMTSPAFGRCGYSRTIGEMRLEAAFDRIAPRPRFSAPTARIRDDPTTDDRRRSPIKLSRHAWPAIGWPCTATSGMMPCT